MSHAGDEIDRLRRRLQELEGAIYMLADLPSEDIPWAAVNLALLLAARAQDERQAAAEGLE